MKRKAGAKSSAKLVRSPFLQSSRRSKSTYNFNPDDLNGSPPSRVRAIPPASSPSLKSFSTISDLREFVTNRSDSIKKFLDQFNSEVLKELESSKSRNAKRMKVQTQACVQAMDEAEKDCKKVTERINENTDIMKASYSEFHAEVQSAASRVSKVVIPEIMQSMERAIENLRSRHGITSSAK